MSGKDPFEGYDLPEGEFAESKQPSKKAGKPPRKRASEPGPRRTDWNPASFEVGPRSGYIQCENCFHYVPGGSLVIDQIEEVHYTDSSTLGGFVNECKSFERDFEFRELQEIVEKSKSLDEAFDERPRVRGFCAAAMIDGVETYLIPEIKNHNQRCRSFFAGRLPWVECKDCRRFSQPYRRPPDYADHAVSMSDYTHLFSDVDGETANRFLHTIRGHYDSADSGFRFEKQEYEHQLREDITEAIFNDRLPSHDTIPKCRKTYKACAVTNRANRCPHFEPPRYDVVERQVSENRKSLEREAGPRGLTPESAQRERTFDRWFALQAIDPNIREDTDACRAAHESARERWLKNRNEFRNRRLPEPQPPCTHCKHHRYPVEVNPFDVVHFNSKEIMELRNAHRREHAHRLVEERRLATQPGSSLGGPDVPIQNAWCYAFSSKDRNGTVLEYAYCYRVLKAHEKDGGCPGFEEMEPRRKPKGKSRG